MPIPLSRFLQRSWYKTTGRWESALREAAKRDDLKTVKYFVNLGFDCEIALFAAARSGSNRTLAWLVGTQVVLNKHFERGSCLMPAARQSGDPYTLKILERKRKERFPESTNGRTAVTRYPVKLNIW